jgi:hypothetical protein
MGKQKTFSLYAQQFTLESIQIYFLVLPIIVFVLQAQMLILNPSLYTQFIAFFAF